MDDQEKDALTIKMLTAYQEFAKAMAAGNTAGAYGAMKVYQRYLDLYIERTKQAWVH